MAILQVRIPDQEYQLIKDSAKREGKSLSTFVKQLLNSSCTSNDSRMAGLNEKLDQIINTLAGLEVAE
jgi:hypothetical protein